MTRRVLGRGRKILVTGAAAVLLAVSAGGVGAFAALALHDDNGNPISTTRTGTSSVTRVVDRSSLAEIASSVQDSVVSITTGSGEGSGVVLTNDGFVLTNNHVVATAQGGAVKVVFANGKTADAKVIGTDPRTDLAVVKADGVTDLKPATFGSSANMKVGDTVLALGSPLGLEGSVTAGIVSAKDRTIRAGGEGQQQPNPFGQEQEQQQTGATSMSGLLQTDAPINPGNSGGALVNTAGEVIGINSAIATSGQSSGNIGLGFAIPSDKAKDVADQLMLGKKVSHPAARGQRRRGRGRRGRDQLRHGEQPGGEGGTAEGRRRHPGQRQADQRLGRPGGRGAGRQGRRPGAGDVHPQRRSADRDRDAGRGFLTERTRCRSGHRPALTSPPRWAARPRGWVAPPTAPFVHHG